MNNQSQNPNLNNNNNNMLFNQMQFNPYGYQRLPVYSAPLIHGQNAAWQFPMGANSEIYLPDADEDIIWWIRTDGQGNKNVQPFDVKPHKEAESVDLNNIISRLSAVEEWINAKSNKSNAKQRNVATTINQPTVE